MALAFASRRGPWLVVALAAPLAFSAWWLFGRPFAPSVEAYEAELDRALGVVLEQHAARAKLGFASAEQTRRLVRELSLDSVPYLAPADLDLWAELRLEVARSSRSACAKLWRGASDEFLGNAVAALGRERLRAWSELLARGLARRLEKATAPQPALSAIERAVEEVTRGMSEAERRAFRDDAEQRTLGEARSCELFLALSEGARRLAPAVRHDLYRALARELRGVSTSAAPEGSR